MRARLRLVCRKLHRLDCIKDLSPEWTRYHPGIPLLDPTCRRFWRHLCKEMALLDWPMPEPHRLVAKMKDSTIVPHELWVYWKSNGTTIRGDNGLMVYTGISSGDVHEFYTCYQIACSDDIGRGDMYMGDGYSKLDRAIYEGILRVECPACHIINAKWYNTKEEYGYCYSGCGSISSKTRDSCPTCGSKDINPDTNGWTWCRSGGFCCQFVNL